MPTSFRVEIRGLDLLRFILSRSRQETAMNLGRALYEEGTVIFNETQRVTPVRYGVLRGTGHIEAPVITSQYVEVTMGYGGPAAPYAVFVHERVVGMSGRPIRHDPPTKAKFLEDPVLEAASTFSTNVAQRLAGQVFQA